jgi:class 3 adenylate cyclase
MPRMDWEVFQRNHHRPHLLVVSLKAKGRNNLAVVRADFERLATKLEASGNYAFKTEGTTIYAAFEDDSDAARFAAVLRPLQTTRESEWASKALASMDDAAYRRITALLKRGRRTAKRRKPKRR